MSTLLFVYGSLKRGFTNPFAVQLQHEAHFVCEGRLQGLLLSLGPYPAVIPQPNTANWVQGEIYELGAQTDQLLHSMDVYEGYDPKKGEANEYRRELVDIMTDQGELSCWCYVYNRDWVQLPVVKSGVWSVR